MSIAKVLAIEATLIKLSQDIGKLQLVVGDHGSHLRQLYSNSTNTISRAEFQAALNQFRPSTILDREDGDTFNLESEVETTTKGKSKSNRDVTLLVDEDGHKKDANLLNDSVVDDREVRIIKNYVSQLEAQVVEGDNSIKLLQNELFLTRNEVAILNNKFLNLEEQVKSLQNGEFLSASTSAVASKIFKGKLMSDLSREHERNSTAGSNKSEKLYIREDLAWKTTESDVSVYSASALASALNAASKSNLGVREMISSQGNSRSSGDRPNTNTNTTTSGWNSNLPKTDSEFADFEEILKTATEEKIDDLLNRMMKRSSDNSVYLEKVQQLINLKNLHGNISSNSILEVLRDLATISPLYSNESSSTIKETNIENRDTLNAEKEIERIDDSIPTDSFTISKENDNIYESNKISLTSSKQQQQQNTQLPLEQSKKYKSDQHTVEAWDALVDLSHSNPIDFEARENMRLMMMAVQVMDKKLSMMEVASVANMKRVDNGSARVEKLHSNLKLLDSEHTALFSSHKELKKSHSESEAALFSITNQIINVVDNCQGNIERQELHSIDQAKQIKMLSEAQARLRIRITDAPRNPNANANAGYSTGFNMLPEIKELDSLFDNGVVGAGGGKGGLRESDLDRLFKDYNRMLKAVAAEVKDIGEKTLKIIDGSIPVVSIETKSASNIKESPRKGNYSRDDIQYLIQRLDLNDNPTIISIKMEIEKLKRKVETDSPLKQVTTLNLELNCDTIEATEKQLLLHKRFADDVGGEGTKSHFSNNNKRQVSVYLKSPSRDLLFSAGSEGDNLNISSLDAPSSTNAPTGNPIYGRYLTAGKQYHQQQLLQKQQRKGQKKLVSTSSNLSANANATSHSFTASSSSNIDLSIAIEQRLMADPDQNMVDNPTPPVTSRIREIFKRYERKNHGDTEAQTQTLPIPHEGSLGRSRSKSKDPRFDIYAGVEFRENGREGGKKYDNNFPKKRVFIQADPPSFDDNTYNDEIITAAMRSAWQKNYAMPKGKEIISKVNMMLGSQDEIFEDSHRNGASNNIVAKGVRWQGNQSAIPIPEENDLMDDSALSDITQQSIQ